MPKISDYTNIFFGIFIMKYNFEIKFLIFNQWLFWSLDERNILCEPLTINWCKLNSHSSLYEIIEF